MLRGFYALELNRTVFLIQCVVAATNIVAAVVLVAATDAEHTSPALVLAYTASYVVGSTLSYLVLRHLLGGLETRRLARFVVRLVLAAAVSTAVAYGSRLALDEVDTGPGLAIAAVRAAVITGVDIAVFLAAARLLHLREVTDVVATITRGLGSRGAA